MRKLLAIFLLILLVASVAQPWFFKAHAAQLTTRSLELSSSSVGATNVVYNLQFTLATAGTLGSIVLELCTNDPFPITPCTPPAGLNMSAATLTGQSGAVGFSIDASSTSNKIVLTRAPAVTAITPVNYIFQGITNPSAASTYYGRIVTYATNDASGAPTDKAGIAWATLNLFSLNTEVPQFLEFCVGITISAFDCSTATGSYINFGNLTPGVTSAGTSQFVSATNAAFGYSVGVYGLTMISGTNAIPALNSQTFPAPGNSQFGFNVRANSLPAAGTDPVGPGVAGVNVNYNTPDKYRFNDGDQVVSSAGTSDFRKFTETYVANVSASQPAGQYSTTLTYVCLANF
jgi:hypothetical protein